MSEGLLSSIVQSVVAAPRVYDLLSFFIVCAFYLFFYFANAAALPFFSAAYANWRSQENQASARGGKSNEVAIKEMRRFRLYVGSTLNSIVCVSIATFMITEGFFVAPSNVASASTRLCCWWLSGYFVADLLLGIRDAKEYPSDVVHHVLGLTLVSSFLVADAPLQKFLAPYGLWFFISESSTIPLNIIYMLEKNGALPSATSIFILKRLFLFCFVICRVVLMPAFAVVHLSFFSDAPSGAGFLFAATSCWGLSFLQFYFFTVVVREVRSHHLH